jgi:hypothetical protein
MSTTEPLLPESSVTPRKLWFGFASSAAAWVTLGCLDLLITWRACMTQEDYGIPVPRPEVRILYFVLALVLLAITVSAGVISYRNWRRLSAQSGLLDTQAVERREFMALIGVIVSVTLGMGIVFLALPPLFLDLCWRAR